MNCTIYFQSFLFSLMFILQSCHAQDNQYVNCWQNAYKDQIDLIKELEKLEQQLLTLEILEGTSINDYKKLYEKMVNRSLDEKALKHITSPKFLSIKPYQACNDVNYNPLDTKETLKYGMLFSLYLLRASDHAKIYFDVISNQQIKINTQPVSPQDLQGSLSNEVEKLNFKGVPTDEVIISLQVAAEVKMGIISDIQQTLKKLDLKKVLYSTLDSDE